MTIIFRKIRAYSSRSLRHYLLVIQKTNSQAVRWSQYWGSPLISIPISFHNVLNLSSSWIETLSTQIVTDLGCLLNHLVVRHALPKYLPAKIIFTVSNKEELKLQNAVSRISYLLVSIKRHLQIYIWHLFDKKEHFNVQIMFKVGSLFEPCF